MKIDRIPITSREQWLRQRRQDVTASVAGALMGVHDYTTPFQLWLEKTGQAPPVEETPSMQRGRLLEPVAGGLLAERFPEIRFSKPDYYLRAPELRVGATPDLIAVCPKRGRGVAQIKSVEPSVYRKRWFDGDDRERKFPIPPLWIMVQATIEAVLEKAEWAAVSPMVVSHGIDIDLIEIPIKEGIFQNIARKTEEFWAAVKSKTPPPADFAKDGEALAALYLHTKAKTIDVTGDNRFPAVCREFLDGRAAIKALSERQDELRTELIEKLGEHEAARHPDFIVKFPTLHRKAYVVDAGSYRRLTINALN